MKEVKLARNNVKLAYYNYDKLYSFNAAYNFLIGARGLGKTYGAKKKAIKKALHNDEQFIYLRRYKSELIARNTFFTDVQHEFPKWDFRVNGATAEAAPSSTRQDKKRPWRVLGYFIALSTAQSQKSVAFPAVTTIIFDEFIIEKGAIHYLPNEAIAFNNFYATVDRWKDKTKVLFLANSVSINNPYFLEYDIKPDQVGEFKSYYDGFIVCHFADSSEFSTGVYQTAFGKFIKDTEYAEYAVGSEFSDNNDNLLQLKTTTAKYAYTVETVGKGTFSVWIDWDVQYYYVQEKRPKSEMLFTMDPSRMKDGKILLQYNDHHMQILRTAFRNGHVFFDTPKARNSMIEIFKR